MKNKLYYLGLTACILILFGCMFKISHWPGAGIILTVGLLFFCFVFLPSAIVSCLKSEDEKKFVWLYVIAYVTIAFNFLSALFKIMHWPGSGILLAIGIPLPFILFLPAYLRYNRNEKEINYRNFVGIMFFFAYFAAVSALLSVSVSKDVLDESVVAAYQVEQKESICTDQIALIRQGFVAGDSSDQMRKEVLRKIQEGSDQLCKSVNDLKVDLVKSANKKNAGFIESNGQINLWQILGKDNSSPVIAGSEAVSHLKGQLADYRQLLLSIAKNGKGNSTEYIDHLLSTNGNGEVDWETITFSGRNLITTIGTLNLIKYNVALAELEVITAMNSNSAL